MDDWGMEKELALYRFKLEMEKGERSILEEERKLQAFRNLDAARTEISQYLPEDFLKVCESLDD
ncbi:MAG: hypothetical protein IJ733_10065 [Lachnospiraceae bacterium]|nr:hypothetical protein [Lachnospiraceae bacterium]